MSADQRLMVALLLIPAIFSHNSEKLDDASQASYFIVRASAMQNPLDLELVFTIDSLGYFSTRLIYIKMFFLAT